MNSIIGHKIFKKFLNNVKNDNLEAVKSKINLAKKFDKNRKYIVLLNTCRHSCDDMLQIILDNIYPLSNRDMEDMVVLCARQGALAKLGILMKRYPKIRLDLLRFFNDNITSPHILTVLEMLADTPEKVMNACLALRYCFVCLGNAKEHDHISYIRGLIHKFVNMTQFFNEHVPAVELLLHNECELAERLLSGMTNPVIRHMVYNDDVSFVCNYGNMQAVQLLIKYYYQDTIDVLTRHDVFNICGRLDLTSLVGLFDMLTEKYGMENNVVREFFCRAYSNCILVNLRIIMERYPEVDMTGLAESIDPVQWDVEKFNKTKEWVCTMFPSSYKFMEN